MHTATKPITRLARLLAPLLFSPEDLRAAISDEFAARDECVQPQPSPDLLERHAEACREREAIDERISRVLEEQAADEALLAEADTPDQRLLYRQRLLSHGDFRELLDQQTKEADRKIEATWVAAQSEVRRAARRNVHEWRSRLAEQRDFAQARLDVILPQALHKLCELLEVDADELQTLVRDLFVSAVALEADASRFIPPADYAARALGLAEAPHPLTYVPRPREAAAS
jgi:hypothetical protein